MLGDFLLRNKQVLSNYSQQNKLLWINEYGWNTADEVYKSQALTEVLTSLKSDEYSYVYMVPFQMFFYTCVLDHRSVWGCCG